MLNIFKYGPNKPVFRFLVWSNFPLTKLAKSCSNIPILKWFFDMLFIAPFSDVTAIPINQRVENPENFAVPKRVLEKLVSGLDDIYISDYCICRVNENCTDYPHDIGCMGMGAANRRMHPSLGKPATKEQAIAHINRAAEAGLVASVAHSWMDPLLFGSIPFGKCMFICFCDDCCCAYRTHMKNRGPNLNNAYKKLPGVSIVVDKDKCQGCGECVRKCNFAEMHIIEEKASPGKDCKGCGMCVEKCPNGAISLEIENEEILYQNLVNRIKNVADIWPQQPALKS